MTSASVRSGRCDASKKTFPDSGSGSALLRWAVPNDTVGDSGINFLFHDGTTPPALHSYGQQTVGTQPTATINIRRCNYMKVAHRQHRSCHVSENNAYDRILFSFSRHFVYGD